MTTNQETVVNCPCLSLLIFLHHILSPDLEQILVSIYLSTCRKKRTKELTKQQNNKLNSIYQKGA